MLSKMTVETFNEDHGIFFADQLKYLEKEIYRVEYAEFLGKQLFDVDESIPPGFTSGAYRAFDIRGKAKWINGAAKDLPRVDLSGKEVPYPIKTLGDSFGYDVLEIQAAQQAGLNLETERSNAAAYIVEADLDEAIFNGVPDLGIDGLLTNSDVTEVSAADIGAGVTEWENKSPDQILADVNAAFAQTNIDSKGRERPSKMGIPIKQYNDIAFRRLGTTSDTTVLEYIVSKSPYLSSMDDVIALHYFTGAGLGSTDLMMIWDPNPRKVQVKLPLDTTVMSEFAQLNGLEVETPVIARFGGTIIRFPGSMRKVYGI